ncbi:MAG: hypothetical protein QM676_07265 [Novosphingobium sp.]
MSGAALLPAGFAPLEPFVARFAASTSAGRAAVRDRADPGEQAAFFAAAEPLLDAALDHLDQRDLRALTPAERNLMNLMLALAHVAQAVEVHGAAEAALTPWRGRMTITRSPADA